MEIYCDDPNDSNYNTGESIDRELLETHDLKPGDHVLYKINKNRDVIILGKIQIEKNIIPVKN